MHAHPHGQDGNTKPLVTNCRWRQKNYDTKKVTLSNWWRRLRKSCNWREITQASGWWQEDLESADDNDADAAAADDDDAKDDDDCCRSITTAK